MYFLRNQVACPEMSCKQPQMTQFGVSTRATQSRTPVRSCTFLSQFGLTTTVLGNRTRSQQHFQMNGSPSVSSTSGFQLGPDGFQPTKHSRNHWAVLGLKHWKQNSKGPSWLKEIPRNGMNGMCLVSWALTDVSWFILRWNFFLILRTNILLYEY